MKITKLALVITSIFLLSWTILSFTIMSGYGEEVPAFFVSIPITFLIYFFLNKEINNKL
jgi:hypothetical protein